MKETRVGKRHRMTSISHKIIQQTSRYPKNWNWGDEVRSSPSDTSLRKAMNIKVTRSGNWETNTWVWQFSLVVKRLTWKGPYWHEKCWYSCDPSLDSVHMEWDLQKLFFRHPLPLEYIRGNREFRSLTGMAEILDYRNTQNIQYYLSSSLDTVLRQ